MSSASSSNQSDTTTVNLFRLRPELLFVNSTALAAGFASAVFGSGLFIAGFVTGLPASVMVCGRYTTQQINTAGGLSLVAAVLYGLGVGFLVNSEDTFPNNAFGYMGLIAGLANTGLSVIYRAIATEAEGPNEAASSLLSSGDGSHRVEMSPSSASSATSPNQRGNWASRMVSTYFWGSTPSTPASGLPDDSTPGPSL